MAKLLVLCSADFSTEEELESFGTKLKRLDLDYSVCGSRLTVEHTGEDWLMVVQLFEPLPKRSIVVKSSANTTVNVRI